MATRASYGHQFFRYALPNRLIQTPDEIRTVFRSTFNIAFQGVSSVLYMISPVSPQPTCGEFSDEDIPFFKITSTSCGQANTTVCRNILEHSTNPKVEALKSSEILKGHEMNFMNPFHIQGLGKTLAFSLFSCLLVHFLCPCSLQRYSYVCLQLIS